MPTNEEYAALLERIAQLEARDTRRRADDTGRCDGSIRVPPNANPSAPEKQHVTVRCILRNGHAATHFNGPLTYDPGTNEPKIAGVGRNW